MIMHEGSVFLGLINVLTGVLLIGISIPLARRKIKMNHLYGFRIPKAFESDDNWYAINAYGAKQLIRWSVLIVIAGLVCFAIPMDDPNEGLLPLILGGVPLMVFLLIPVILTLLYARKL